MNRVCIYHGGCDDGFGAAYAVWRSDPSVTFYPGVYQEAPPWHLIDSNEVIIVDFSYSADVTRQILQRAARVLILDHHKSAQEALRAFAVDGSLNKPFWKNTRKAWFDEEIAHAVLFDMERSGAMMAWDFFNGTSSGVHDGTFEVIDRPRPMLIDHIQDRDLWRHSLPQTPLVSMYLRSWPQAFSTWHVIAQMEPARMYEAGENILRYYREVMKSILRNTCYRMIGPYEVPVCNAPYAFASDLANDLCLSHPARPFAATWFTTKDKVQFSLRSREGAIDVSEIAKRYGGGGHKHAAGFLLPQVEAQEAFRLFQ